MLRGRRTLLPLTAESRRCRQKQDLRDGPPSTRHGRARLGHPRPQRCAM